MSASTPREAALAVLARAAMQDPHLVAELRQIVARLEMTATGTTPSYQPSGRSRATSGGRPATGDDWPPWLLLLERIARAQTMAALRAALDWGEAQLQATIRGPRMHVSDETPRDRHLRIIKHGSGWPAAEVARNQNVTIRQVYDARQTEGVDLMDGLPLREAKVLTAEERLRQAEKMRANGIPYTRIAKQLGCSADTIRRDLGHKAAR